MKKSEQREARRYLDILYKNEDITNWQELAKVANVRTNELIATLKHYGDSYNWVKNILDANLKMKSIGSKGTYLGIYGKNDYITNFIEYDCIRAVIKRAEKLISYSNIPIKLENGDILISMTRDKSSMSTYVRIMEVVYPVEGIGMLIEEKLIPDAEKPKISVEVPIKEKIESFIDSYRENLKK